MREPVLFKAQGLQTQLFEEARKFFKGTKRDGLGHGAFFQAAQGAIDQKKGLPGVLDNQVPVGKNPGEIKDVQGVADKGRFFTGIFQGLSQGF